MSIQPVEWHDYDPDTGVGSPDTPLSAATLNQMQAFIKEQADRATAAASEAEAPTDAMVAGLVGSASSTQTAADARYVPRAKAAAAGYLGLWGDLIPDSPAAAVANSALIASALSQTNAIRLPSGKFFLDSTIVLAGSKRLYGSGKAQTVLTSASEAMTTIRANASGEGAGVFDLTVSKEAVPSSAAAIGVDFGLTSGGATIRGVIAQRHGHGFRLGGTDYSQMESSRAQWNAGNGVLLTNAASSVASIQWYLTDVLCQGNLGDGFRIQSSPGKGPTSVGKLARCATFANSGRGIIVYAASYADRVESARITEGFFGQDGLDELYMDTWGEAHQITNCFFELSGSMATGPGIFGASGSTVTTPTSNAGFGISLTANNTGAVITGCQVIRNSRTGIYSMAADLLASNNLVYDNGRAAVASQTYGIHIGGGSAVLTGNRSRNRAGANQTHGFYFGTTDVTYVGNDGRDNATAATGGSTPAVNANNR